MGGRVKIMKLLDYIRRIENSSEACIQTPLAVTMILRTHLEDKKKWHICVPWKAERTQALAFLFHNVLAFTSQHIHPSMTIDIYLFAHIYIYIERERERGVA